MVPPPEVISLTQVTIAAAPDGARKTVQNPLYNYKFHPIDKSFPPPYSEWQSTFRHPKGSGSNTTDDIPALKQ